MWTESARGGLRGQRIKGRGSQEWHLLEGHKYDRAEQDREGYGTPAVPVTMLGASSPALPTPVASGENMPNVSKVIGSYFLVASHVC